MARTTCGASGCIVSVSGEGATETVAGGQKVIAFPQVSTDLTGRVFFDTNTCVGDEGAWIIDQAPTHGEVTTEIRWEHPRSEFCQDKLMPFNYLIYKWTDTADKNHTDKVVATWTAQGILDERTFDIDKARIVVDSADLAETGDVALSLVARKKDTGKVKLTFVGGGVTYAQTSTESLGPGDTKIKIDRPRMAEAKYTKVKAEWALQDTTLKSDYTPPSPWNVLGVIRYTQYNTPLESKCSPKTTQAYLASTITDCQFDKITLSERFRAETYENGTGRSTGYGLIHIGKNTKLMQNCPKKGWPAGATEKNIFVQVSDIRGSCNTVLQPGVSLATDPAKMSCRQTAELVDSGNANFSQRVRADTCFGCEPKQIDAYVAIDSCKGKDVGDLGDYWTMTLD